MIETLQSFHFNVLIFLKAILSKIVECVVVNIEVINLLILWNLCKKWWWRLVIVVFCSQKDALSQLGANSVRQGKVNLAGGTSTMVIYATVPVELRQLNMIRIRYDYTLFFKNVGYDMFRIRIKNLKPIIYLLNINKHKIEITNNYDPKIQNTGITLLKIWFYFLFWCYLF